MLANLVQDIGTSTFSLIIDESTDISTTKFLAVMIKFYSNLDNKIRTEFLGLLEVYRATANALWTSLKEYLIKLGLDYKNQCTGLGTGHGRCQHPVWREPFCVRPHESGSKQSTWAFLLTGLRSLTLKLLNVYAIASTMLHLKQQLKCPVTSNLWSGKPEISFVERLQYRDLYAAINNGEMPRALVQLVKTRWLAWARAISVIIDQWLELKLHFDNHNKSLVASDKCAIGRKLYECYHQNAHLLYLKFLGPITKELNALNLKFQAT
ncbi:Zinc finger MYM-type protein 1 [Frankliniella fusca]|uniref:Zinc finger MYM-type protein 1 n=1 Tax=Frankliniella fusca TaxID=407009 RepID=A0AAE1H688_9NEOP|nr:Zinc finger MYM-type protein 1 [Frankliniella fusca]